MDNNFFVVSKKERALFRQFLCSLFREINRFEKLEIAGKLSVRVAVPTSAPTGFSLLPSYRLEMYTFTAMQQNRIIVGLRNKKSQPTSETVDCFI